jgi:hypothetical protein
MIFPYVVVFAAALNRIDVYSQEKVTQSKCAGQDS